MADRTPSDSPLASDRVGDNNWTAGFPHDFKGWGPQTPDPAEDTVEIYTSGEGLHYNGDDDEHRHIVWRFDRRKHH